MPTTIYTQADLDAVEAEILAITGDSFTVGPIRIDETAKIKALIEKRAEIRSALETASAFDFTPTAIKGIDV